MRKDVDLRPFIGSDVLDQGLRPTCVVVASSAAHEALRTSNDHLAPEALWWQAAKAGHTSDQGMLLNSVDPALRRHGQPALASWPYNPHLGAGTENPPSDLSQPPWLRAELHDLPLLHDGDEEPLEEALSRDRPVILVLEVTDELLLPGEDGIVAVPDVRTSAGGYHAVACVGAANHPAKGRLLLVKNSWGEGWALGGYCWLPTAYLIGFAVQAATINNVSTESRL